MNIMNRSIKDASYRVSIVVPVFNVEKYVIRCLKSIEKQTYKNIEIIVVDDGSTDRSGQLCDEEALIDKRIKIIHQKNQGLSAARNMGLVCSLGEYVCFIDSDDKVADDFVEKLLTTAVISGAEIVQCSIKAFIYESEIVNIKQTDVYNIFSGRDMCINLFKGIIQSSGVVQNKLYKRTLFDDIVFRKGKLHEDEFIVYRLFYKSRNVAVIQSELYYYQSKREDSITNSEYNIRRLDAVMAAEEKCLFFSSEGDKILYDNAVAACCRCILENRKKVKRSSLDNKKIIIRQLRGKFWKYYSVILFSNNINLKRKIGILFLEVKSLF